MQRCEHHTVEKYLSPDFSPIDLTAEPRLGVRSFEKIESNHFSNILETVRSTKAMMSKKKKKIGCLPRHSLVTLPIL